MLVLARRRGEEIVIDDQIRVTVVQVRGDTVRLGIVAPTSVPVYRKEVWIRCQAEKQAEAAPVLAQPRRPRRLVIRRPRSSIRMSEAVDVMAPVG